MHSNRQGGRVAAKSQVAAGFACLSDPSLDARMGRARMIHPLPDDNGRVGRAFAQTMLRAGEQWFLPLRIRPFIVTLL